MARMARLVVPHFPHHVTQRGNRRQRTFSSEEDYRAYMALLADARTQAGVEVWAYCLVPNHVHLVVVPEHPDSLSAFFGDAHLSGKDDDLVKVQPMLSRISDWRRYLVGNEEIEELEYIRQHARTGRPVGDNAFLNRLEQLTRRSVRRGRPGPKIQK